MLTSFWPSVQAIIRPCIIANLRKSVQLPHFKTLRDLIPITQILIKLLKHYEGNDTNSVYS